MRYIFFILLSISLFNPVISTKIIPDTHSVVIQLFTSQGCSSCPPADALVEKIKKEYAEKNVIIMSYHVDYWDRLGWKDPFGKKEYTEIQYAYAKKFRENRVYTPQIVVNGKEHFIGSDEYVLRRKLKSYLKKKVKNPVKLSATKKENTLDVTYNVSGDVTSKTIIFALVLEKETTKVKRGENASKALTNSNIVIQQKKVSLDTSHRGKVDISIPKIAKGLRLIAFVQDTDLTITGAHQITF